MQSQIQYSYVKSHPLPCLALPPSQQQQQPTSRTQQNKCKEKSLPCALGLFTKPCYLCTLDNTILPNALSKTHKLYVNAN